MSLFSIGGRRKAKFAEAMLRSFPASMVVPEPLRDYFHWLDDVGAVRHDGELPYALVTPDQVDLSMLIELVDPNFAVAWVDKEYPEAAQRLAPFARLGGDGSYAGLWLNDEGCTQFVQHGSGSGSTLLCTLTDDPIDFLSLLGIGYDELSWPEDFSLSPEEIQNKRLSEEADYLPHKPPHQLRDWVEAKFDVKVPETADKIVRATSKMEDDVSDDPFWNWIRSMQKWNEESK